MALTIETQVLMSGTKYVVLKVFITGAADDTGVIYDASSYFNGNTNIRLMKINYEFSGFSAKLTWGGKSNTDLISLAEDDGTQLDANLDFRDFRGIPNKNVGEKTGDIEITTTNISTGDSGYIILYVEDYSPAPGFQVLDLGPKLWFDALESESVERSSANIINTWEEKSGNYQHASQSTPSQKPLYTIESTSGLPSLFFSSGSSQELEGSFTSPFSNESFSIFVVSRGITDNSGVIIGASTVSSFNRFEMTYFLTTPKVNMFIGDGVTRDLPDFSWTVPNNNSLHYLTCTRDSTAVNGIKGYDNGSFVTQGTATRTGNSVGFLIGGRAGAGFHLNGYVSSIIVCDYQVSAVNLTNVHDYNSDRWGI